ncbi:hypothetical protein [Salmonella phage SSBI34]|nr:hypothetical protein [Salmonella phage SSBI34]
MTNCKYEYKSFKDTPEQHEEGENKLREVLNRDVFIPDPFFSHLENSEKYKDIMKKAKDLADMYDISVNLSPDSQPKVDKEFVWMDEMSMDLDRLYIDFVKKRSTGRLKHTCLPDIPNVNPKGKTLTKYPNGLHLDMESKIDWKKFEDMCKQDIPAKHPMIFKITDLVEDPEEFARLECMLERTKTTSEYTGWAMTPIFVEAVPGCTSSINNVDPTMKRLIKLASEYKVEIYFGTKTALKTAMYQTMYGARKEDMDLSKVEILDSDKVETIMSKYNKVALFGAGPRIGNNIFYEFAAVANVEKPVKEWTQGKLRRGKGHNKLKKRGKK